MSIAKDKWREDIRPIIEASRFRDLVPTRGRGSRGGEVDAVEFKHGPTLRFMSGGGDDKTRSSFTAPVVFITEVDGMDTPSLKSREASKVHQLEARTRGFRDDARIYLECTASISKGRIWQEFIEGSRSQITLKCPYCSASIVPLSNEQFLDDSVVSQYVDIWQQHVIGWQSAETDAIARDASYFVCPECKHAWTERDRYLANLNSRLYHRSGFSDPKVETFSFRWSAINNFFSSAGIIGVEEWRKERDSDNEDRKKESSQFTWALPYDGEEPEEFVALTANYIRSRRCSTLPPQTYPVDTLTRTIGVDLGKYLLHYVVLATDQLTKGFIVEYGIREVPSYHLGMQSGILNALVSFRDELFPRICPNQVWIDIRGGDKTESWFDTVMQFMSDPQTPPFCKPSQGRGGAATESYAPPKQVTDAGLTRFIGNHYHIEFRPENRRYMAVADASYWKAEVHRRLLLDHSAPSSLLLYQESKQHHLTFAKHITAEVRERTITPTGPKIRFVKLRDANHYLDATYLALAAADYIIRYTNRPTQKTDSKVTVSPVTFLPTGEQNESRNQPPPRMPRNTKIHNKPEWTL
jgi:hypothetical protein